MKYGVVVFPGSNCDRDMQDALAQDLGQEVIMLWHKSEDLSAFTQDDCIVLPGGFSYGDYLRCGAIARFSPIMKQIIAFANNGGKVLGVCNGFQVLCEAGLLPGALLRNDKQKFICKNLYLKPEGYFKDLVLSDVESLQKSYKIPIAHGEGRYFAEDNILDELEANGQVIFRYSDENGNVVPEANPNGSLRNIAGICNATRNVFGMMPHPERACSAVLGNIDGQKILQVLLMAKQPA
ncbi:MAG TPA: phosphoribosylformylglycinamidine synthase subunit PurQ [Niabella sp.]|nr:phosphoribosylformylglycinamidine synthase subunit PurQ [Niabella sp.]HOZ97911.1 phosphoribosylformylglycinamidine synthase subunit PurQ [Niabella sp.]HQW15943.1 phosphoribosylformylglycinamidine synthase subunit PurQ [Niabella sp.]HQX21109.1 phosphoribosylformylglycinamidine synthase subunit PurQ [Niabella sp.]HQX40557.1 phosphoribosylformylglycinamidine synthase subunit PurQ [Niabella sp.]